MDLQRAGILSCRIQGPDPRHCIRPGARYSHSLDLLNRAKEQAPEIFTKSGIMVGIGEKQQEVFQVMDDLLAASHTRLRHWHFVYN